MHKNFLQGSPGTDQVKIYNWASCHVALRDTPSGNRDNANLLFLRTFSLHSPTPGPWAPRASVPLLTSLGLFDPGLLPGSFPKWLCSCLPVSGMHLHLNNLGFLGFPEKTDIHHEKPQGVSVKGSLKEPLLTWPLGGCFCSRKRPCSRWNPLKIKSTSKICWIAPCLPFRLRLDKIRRQPCLFSYYRGFRVMSEVGSLWESLCPTGEQRAGLGALRPRGNHTTEI